MIEPTRGGGGAGSDFGGVGGSDGMSADQLPHGWSCATLGEVASWGSGGTPSRSNAALYGGSISWFKTGELGPRQIFKSEETITEEALKVSSAKLFPAGSVALAMYGATIGKVSILGLEAATNQACAVGIPKETITNTAYLYHYLRSQKEAFVEAGQGGAQPNISQTVVKSWPFPVAPLNEQKRIADKLDTVLTRVDAVNTRLARVAPLLKRFRQSVLAAATSGRLTEDWRSDHATNAEWTHTTLGNVIAEMRNGLAAKPDEKPSGSKILRISAIRPGELDANDHRYLTTSSQESSTYSLKAGDLLFTRYNGSLEFVGVCAMVGQDLSNYVYPDKLIRVRAKPELALPKYLELACSASAARVQIEGFVKSSAGQKGISGADLKSLSLSIPRIDEQTEIVRRVETLFAFADRLEARLAQAQTAATRLTPALLAKAFRGELVPQDPNDEPAAELLRRLASSPTAPAKRGRAAKAT